MFSVRFSQNRLYDWSKKWPCSSLVTGTAYFDSSNGDLVDLSGKLAKADVDGHEFDAFVDDYQSKELKAVRGNRCG